MEILAQNLPSGGYGYPFPSITIKPMTFIEIVGYLESVPSDKLDRYLFDIKAVTADDPNINNCYIMDLDYLIFMKKFITVSKDLSLKVTVKCPKCGNKITKYIKLSDITFKAADPMILAGAEVELNGGIYNITAPTVNDFIDVFGNYLRSRKISDLDTIKIISLFKEFNTRPNVMEHAVMNSMYDNITLLLALKDLYFNRTEPIIITCDECSSNNDEEGCEEGGSVTVSVNDLIVDFFREIIINNPINENKIKFKQIQ